MPAGVPYEIQPIGGIRVPGGAVSYVKIGFPSRSSITKIVVVQTGGAPGPFTAALYSNESAARGQLESVSADGQSVVLPPDLYRVTPDLASDADGRLVYISESHGGGIGFTFVNLDHPASEPGQIGNPRHVYLQLTPSGAGELEFAVALAGDAYA